MNGALQIVALVFPNMTQLDFTGPAQVFAHYPDAELHLAWHSTDPVPTDSGFAIVPTVALDQAPQADVLFIPGGQGTFEVIDDAAVLDFISRQAAGARYITSVCTGSFLLGAAGLLQGRRATTHWASLSLLEKLGAHPVSQRVVRDGNIVTGAGVSSGIDFALTLAAQLYDDEVAKTIQLSIEYDPAPPFDAGSPTSPEADPQQVHGRITVMTSLRESTLDRVAERLRA